MHQLFSRAKLLPALLLVCMLAACGSSDSDDSSDGANPGDGGTPTQPSEPTSPELRCAP